MFKEKNEVTRRGFLKAAGLTGTALGLSACGAAPGRS
ncbi:MAG: twin-arginine translocation signal domain-containing protein, partial [Anaerolineae bacterium]